MDVCLEVGSKPVVSEFKDFVKCFSHICHDKECKSGDKECLSKCIWNRCAGFAIKCNSDQKSGFKACDTGFGCFSKCENKNTVDCTTACYQEMSKSAQDDFDTLWYCVANSDKPDPFADCMIPALNCVSAGQKGQNSCLEIAECGGTCNGKPKAEGDEFNCIAKTCYAQGNEKAQALYKDMLKCMIEAGDGGYLKCGKSIIACSEPSGSKLCIDIDPCTKECKKNGTDEGSCMFKCLHQATPTEAKKFWDFAECANTKCKKCDGSSDPQCIEKCFTGDCKDEYLGCLGK